MNIPHKPGSVFNAVRGISGEFEIIRVLGAFGIAASDGFTVALGEPVIDIGISPRGDGIAKVGEPPKVHKSGLQADKCHPFPAALVPRHPVETASIGIHPTRVSAIFARRGGAEVAYPVISSVPVDVIDFLGGPFAASKGPRNPMSLEGAAKNTPIQIASRIGRGKRRLSGISSVPSAASALRCKQFAGPLAPHQRTRDFIIVDKLPKQSDGDSAESSHSVSPHVRGQGRALLTQRFRPVLLSNLGSQKQGIAA